jgi:hypothetical protein
MILLFVFCINKDSFFLAVNEKKSRSKTAGQKIRYNARFFFHPDYTVGFGITPNQLSLAGSSAFAALPPVGNYTPPRRQLFKFVNIIT